MCLCVVRGRCVAACAAMLKRDAPVTASWGAASCCGHRACRQRWLLQDERHV